jgi:PAS domain S-box-containing protein
METLGYSYEEIINKNIADFAHPEDFQQEKPLFEELVTGKRDIYQIEERFIHKNGDPIWVSLTISANRDQEGNFISTIEMFENISTKKSYEEGLKQANAELEQANRLKDEFLATMSHELRTPLNSILGMTEGLQEQIYGPLNGKQLKCLDTVQNSGTHLLALINDILDLSKIEAGKLEVHQERISISELCQSTVSLIEESASKKNIALNTEVSQQVSVLEGDTPRYLNKSQYWKEMNSGCDRRCSIYCLMPSSLPRNKALLP